MSVKENGPPRRPVRGYEGRLVAVAQSPRITLPNYQYEIGREKLDGASTLNFAVLTASERLISLWDMFGAYVHYFRAAIEELTDIRIGFALPENKNGTNISEKHRERLNRNLDFWSKLGSALNLEATKHLSDDLVNDIKTGLTIDEIDAKIDSLQVMARKELEKVKFLYVPVERSQFYQNKALCGDLVADKFPDALPEIIEAGNCYALGRTTACVFHLMRVIPYGMAAVAKLLNVKYSQDIKSLDWLAIIQPIDKAIKDIQQTARTPKKIQDMKYFSEIAQHLYFCKDAWRNHISHSIERYDMPQARSVMDHVGLVMQLVSKRLKKPFTGLR